MYLRADARVTDAVPGRSREQQRTNEPVVEVGAALGPRPDLDGVPDGHAGHAGGDDRPEHHPAAPRRLDRAAGVDRQRLHPEPGGAADDGVGARRPLRAPAPARRRAGAVHRGAGAERRLADRGARRPGRRRGDGGAAGDGAARRGLPGGAAGQGAGVLQRRHRARDGRRPAGRWRGGAGAGLAVDLLAQRPHRAAADPAGPQPHRGGPRLQDQPGPRWPRAGDGRGARAGLGLVRANGFGWGSLEVVASLAAGALLLVVAFVAWELRVREPMLPMRFFRSRAFSAGNTAGFLLYGAIFGAAFFFAQFLQTTLHYGPLGTGLRLVPWTITLSLVAPIAGARVNRLGERPLIVAGMLLQAAGFAWIALIARPGLAYPAMVPPLVVAGCGVSMAMPAAQNAVIGAVPRSAIGKASGTFNTLRQLGGTFGIAILAAVFAGTGGYASAQAFSDGFAPAIGVAAGLTLVAAVAGSWTPGRHTVREELPRPVAPELQTVGRE